MQRQQCAIKRPINTLRNSRRRNWKHQSLYKFLIINPVFQQHLPTHAIKRIGLENKLLRGGDNGLHIYPPSSVSHCLITIFVSSGSATGTVSTPVRITAWSFPPSYSASPTKTISAAGIFNNSSRSEEHT